MVSTSHPFDVEVLNKLAGAGQLLPSVSFKHNLSACMANDTQVVVRS